VILPGTSSALEIVTTTAAATEWAASWSDVDKSGASTAVLPGAAAGSISSATTTTIAAAPSADVYRTISSISVYASGTQGVTVQRDVSGSNRRIVAATLAAGESLHYEDGRGWYVMTAAGEVSQSAQAGADGADGVVAVAEVEVDFGATPTDSASATVTDAGISAASVFLCQVSGGSTTDNDADAHAFLALDSAVWAVPGSGSAVVHIQTRDVTATGAFKVRYIYSS